MYTNEESDPAVRFGVYRNNVGASLINALAETYPVTQELVGEQFFRAMARLYVSTEPPRSRVLAFYGESFPIFIENFPPAAGVPYLADVARLEMKRVRAYHSADGAVLTADAIAEILADMDGLPDLTVGFHSSVRLVQSRFAVVSLWAAHQGITDISTVDPYVPENALVMRPRLDVEVISLDISASTFVLHLLQGASLGDALTLTSGANPDFDLADILSLLITQHAISSMNTSKECFNER